MESIRNNDKHDHRRRNKARLHLSAPRKKNKWTKGRKKVVIDGRICYMNPADIIKNENSESSTPSVLQEPCNTFDLPHGACERNNVKGKREGSVEQSDTPLDQSEPGCSYWHDISTGMATASRDSPHTDSSNENVCQYDNINVPDHYSDFSDISVLPSSPGNDYATVYQPGCSEERQPTNRHPAPAIIEGRRIFDVNHLFSEISRISRHSKTFDCNFENLVLIKEERKGMASIYHFQCSMCGIKDTISSEPLKASESSLNINDSWVSSMLHTGQGYSQLRDIASNLEMPCMAKETFQKCQRHLSEVIKEIAWEKMLAAGKEESQIAIEAGEVDDDGVPVIDVVTDGAWCKRSYGTSFNALSGMACIIGARTRKVLFVSTRNTYCCICARASSRGEEAKSHTCYKNWTKSSTAMEADIIVEGFRNSVEMHSLKYKRIIGDGDSSVMKQLIASQPYGPNFFITKIECKNHIIRNYNRRLREISSQTKNVTGIVPAVIRRLLGADSQLRLRVAVTGAIKFRSAQNLPLQNKINELQMDIHNGPYHVFGDHSRCQDRSYFCKGPKVGEVCVVEEMKAVGMWDEIMAAKNLVAHHASSLIHNISTNEVERFNSILCKFVGGKRVNFSLRGGYETRSKLSVIEHNTTGESQKLIHKFITGKSPGFYCNNNIRRKQMSAEKRRKRQQENPKNVKRRRLVMSGPDCHYGNVNQCNELSNEEFERRKDTFIKRLTLDETEINSLQISTTAQYNSQVWLVERSKRLTASSFGRICKMKKSTPRAKTVISLLYQNFHGNKATKYGLEKEPIALEQLGKSLGKTVKASGLFVDQFMPWLAATPDGLIGDDAIVEVKCPYVAAHFTPEHAIENNLIKFCYLENGEQQLKEEDTYMYQIQGQLNITQRKICFFVVWTPLGMLFQKIERNIDFWEKKMTGKLNDFYMNFMLPELVDPQYPKGLPLRDIKQ